MVGRQYKTSNDVINKDAIVRHKCTMIVINVTICRLSSVSGRRVCNKNSTKIKTIIITKQKIEKKILSLFTPPLPASSH